jgi:hypothetical protein
MADNSETSKADRRDPIKDGSSLSGSTQRNNDATEKALHPDRSDSDTTEFVDQDPGERQKENQNQSKDDPLAA